MTENVSSLAEPPLRSTRWRQRLSLTKTDEVLSEKLLTLRLGTTADLNPLVAAIFCYSRLTAFSFSRRSYEFPRRQH